MINFIKTHWKKALYIFIPIIILISLLQYFKPDFISLVVTNIKDSTKKMTNKQEKKEAPSVKIDDIKIKFDPNALNNSSAWAVFYKFKHYINN